MEIKEADLDKAAKDFMKGKRLFCSFCGKSQAEVKKLVAGGPNNNEQKGDKGCAVYICGECIDLCHEIITDDNGNG